MRETLPLRDAFAVLFFVSVGMLFNPGILVSKPLALIATVAIIVGVKAAAGFYLVKLLGHGRDMALTIAASLAQIGEFSFILITMGAKLDIVPPEARDLVVAGAMISILANPLLFHLLDKRWARKSAEAARSGPADAEGDTSQEPRPDAPSAASAALPSSPPPAA
jgi:CPA2 family monovalent cation:H+ antiporter-2